MPIGIETDEKSSASPSLMGARVWRARSGHWLAALLLVALVAGIFSNWTLDSNHFFYADDWGWLIRSQFPSLHKPMGLFPRQLYNDRPGGALIIRAVYAMVGLDARWYNMLWLLLHMVNCAIFFVVAARVVPFSRALLCALVAACWASTLGAVTWIGAIFDLVGATWCLLALLCYADPQRIRWRPWVLTIGAVVFHVLAIRTKEFALALVAVLAAWDLLAFPDCAWRKRLVRLAPHLLITLVYCAIYLHLLLQHTSRATAGAYRMSLSPESLVSGIAYYAASAFYLQPLANASMNLLAGLAIALGVTILAMTSAVGRAALLSAVALLAAVLLLSQQRSELYLYAPHFFLALALGSVRVRSRVATAITALAGALLLAWPWYTGALRNSRRFVLDNGAYSRTLFDDYVAVMHDQPVPRHVTVVVSRTYFDPFTYGPGSAIQLWYRDDKIDVSVLSAASAGTSPCAHALQVCLVEQAGPLVRMK